MKRYYFLFCISIGLGYKLPEGISLCHRSQPDFTQCVAKNMRGGILAFKSGNKEMGVPVLDPYFIEKLEIKPPASGKTVAIHITFNNVYVYGMTTFEIEHLEIDIDKGCSWTAEFLTPVIRVQADYQIEGQLMVFTLNAHGKSNVTQNNLRDQHKMWCEKYQKNGKTHVRITKYTMDMQPENNIFEFTNLFPADKAIEDKILKTINENNLSIFNELKDGFEQIFSMIYLQTSNKVLSKIPLDELFLP
ncbi:unnamed protein product [Psylliodes chrysocephalus]|uniref:Uncharacterized protein n=1 Tax=Psylliodes chrysocephalus TaxID=3402493 RepID=A0A9P0D2N5_9CUCU|nr:unnamed protein product [Psylliodes chrysocephala]